MITSDYGLKTEAGQTDSSSAAHGFSVDTSDYSRINWKPRVVIKVSYNYITVGEATIDCGFARLTKPVFEGGASYNRDTVMMRLTMRGKGVGKKYGYSKDIWIRALNPRYGELLSDVSPLSVARSMTVSSGTSTTSSYSAGNTSSGNSASLSGTRAITSSQSYTVNALEVQNRSSFADQTVDIKFIYNRRDKKENWKIFDTYAYETSVQSASYTYLTQRASYSRSMLIDVEFDVFDGEPSKSSDQLKGKPTAKTSILYIPPFPY